VIPQRRKRAPLGIREPSRINCPAHLKFVRGFKCAAWASGQHECTGKMEAHHVREMLSGGMGIKPDDSEAVPLCSGAHSELHNIGAKTFEAKYKVDLSKVAADLWRVSRHGIKYRSEHGE